MHRLPYRLFVCLYLLMAVITRLGAQSLSTEKDQVIIPKDPQPSDTTLVLNLLKKAQNLGPGDHLQKIDLAGKALYVAERLKFERGIAAAHHIKGVTRYHMGDHPEALSHLQIALEIREKMNDQAKITMILHHIGKIYEVQGQLDKSMEIYQRSLSINRQRNDSLWLATDLSNIGNVYTYSQQYDSGLYYNFKAMEIRTAMHDTVNLLYSYNDIAAVYAHKGVQDSSISYMQKAIDIAERIGEKNYLSLGYYNLASNYLGIGQPAKALVLAEKALELGQRIGSKRGIAFAATLLTQIYAGQQDYKSAFYYLSLQKSYQDSLYSEENIRQISAMTSNFEVKKKEQENELLRREAEIRDTQQRWQLAGGLLVIGLLSGIAAVLYRTNRIRTEANRVLQEKNEEINQQNEEISSIAEVLRQANIEIQAQKTEIERRNKDFISSITYAQRIQAAMLPFEERLAGALQDYFLLLRPRDIVSGDFYWFDTLPDGRVMIAAADCTGHGVPGAFMSMIGISFLEELVRAKHYYSPDELLTHLHAGIRHALKQEDTDNQDGMDIAVCTIDLRTRTLQYAGAMNPIYYLSADNPVELCQLKPDKRSIGGRGEAQRSFTLQTIELTAPTRLYLLTDGWQDQFGGPDGKKYRASQIKQVLANIHHLPMQDQKSHIAQSIDQWMHLGKDRQTDDILVMGVYIG